MTSFSDAQIHARAWLLDAKFDVALHPQLAKADTDQIFPQRVRQYFDDRAAYLKTTMKGLDLITYSMPTALSSLPNQSVVPVLCIFHGSHLLSERTVQTLFSTVPGLTMLWGALHFGPGEAWPSLNEHALFVPVSFQVCRNWIVRDSARAYTAKGIIIVRGRIKDGFNVKVLVLEERLCRFGLRSRRCCVRPSNFCYSNAGTWHSFRYLLLDKRDCKSANRLTFLECSRTQFRSTGRRGRWFQSLREVTVDNLVRGGCIVLPLTDTTEIRRCCCLHEQHRDISPCTFQALQGICAGARHVRQRTGRAIHLLNNSTLLGGCSREFSGKPCPSAFLDIHSASHTSCDCSTRHCCPPSCRKCIAPISAANIECSTSGDLDKKLGPKNPGSNFKHQRHQGPRFKLQTCSKLGTTKLGSKHVLFSGAPCIWLDVKNTLQLHYNYHTIQGREQAFRVTGVFMGLVPLPVLGPVACCFKFDSYATIDLPNDWHRPGRHHFKLSPRFPGRSLAAALPIRASGGSSNNSVLWVQAVIQSISHWVSLFHIFTLNPVGIPAMCSVGIPAVSKL